MLEHEPVLSVYFILRVKPDGEGKIVRQPVASFCTYAGHLTVLHDEAELLADLAGGGELTPPMRRFLQRLAQAAYYETLEVQSTRTHPGLPS